MLYNGRIPEGLEIPQGKLLLAFSGGSDSLFLALMLSVLAPGRTEALYVDHGLRDRKELDREIALNRKNAALLSIPLEISVIPEGIIKEEALRGNSGIEAVARKERYRILFEKARREGFDHVLTAHHRDDQAETVLMRMLEASPFWSYQGILKEDGLLFRPMLNVAKSTILSVLRSSGLEWSEDSTNADTGYLRNNVRHNLLPLLSEETKDNLCNIAANVASFRRRFPSLKPLHDCWFTSISREDFLNALPFQREEFIYKTMSVKGYSGRISRRIVSAVTELAEKGKGRIEMAGFYFYSSKTLITVFPPLYDFSLTWNGECITSQKLSLCSAVPDDLTLIIDENKLERPVVLRNSREGDRIELKDGWKRVSELEKEQRVPYSLLLEDRRGVVAYFARFLGGRDRLSSRFLGPALKGTALAIRWE